MPANVESMFSVREVPWHGEGVILKKRPKSIQEALIAADLDWEVKQVPVQVRVGGKMHKAPGVMANVREKGGEVKLLGVVTKKYKPVQNREAFEFLSNLYGSEMHFETAGALSGGRRVWVLMKLPEYVEVAGDPYSQFAFVSNSHDGKSSVLSACTPIRIVCENTERAAIRGAQRTYMIRHMGDMSTKIAEARNVLGVTIDYYEQFKALGDKLGRIRFSEKRAKETIEQILPFNEEKGDRAAENVEQARAAVLSLFRDGSHPSLEYPSASGFKEIGDTRGNAAGTAWGLYNAATEYADWGRSIRVSRWKRAVDDPDGLKTRAFAVVLERAGVSA